MAGAIAIFSGYQRSGKTFLATAIAESYRRRGLKVYTNMNDVKGFIHVEKLSDIPISDFVPKVILMDELHFFLNSRNFKSQGDFIYFFNTICKRNILFLGTTINLDMIDKNLRTQINYLFISKKTAGFLNYRMFDVQQQHRQDFEIPFTSLDQIEYLTNDIPKMFNFDIANIIS